MEMKIMYVDLIIMNRPQPRQLITFETIFFVQIERSR